MSNLCGGNTVDESGPSHTSDVKQGGEVKAPQTRLFTRLFTCQDETDIGMAPMPSPAGVDEFDDGLSYGNSQSLEGSFGDDISFDDNYDHAPPKVVKTSPDRVTNEKPGFSLGLIAPTFDSVAAVIHRKKWSTGEKNKDDIPSGTKSVHSNFAVKEGLENNRNRTADLRDKIVKTITSPYQRNNSSLPPPPPQPADRSGKNTSAKKERRSLPFQITRVHTAGTDVAVTEKNGTTNTNKKSGKGLPYQVSRVNTAGTDVAVTHKDKTSCSVTGTENAVTTEKRGRKVSPKSSSPGRRVDTVSRNEKSSKTRSKSTPPKHKSVQNKIACDPTKGDGKAAKRKRSKSQPRTLAQMKDNNTTKAVSNKSSQPTILAQADSFGTENAINHGRVNRSSTPRTRQRDDQQRVHRNLHTNTSNCQSNANTDNQEEKPSSDKYGTLLSSICSLFVVKKDKSPETQLEKCVVKAQLESNRKLSQSDRDIEDGRENNGDKVTRKEKATKFMKKHTELFPFGRLNTLVSVGAALIAVVLTYACRSSTKYATLKKSISLGNPYTYVPEVGIFYMEVCLKDQVISTFKNHEGTDYQTVLQVDYEESVYDTHWYPNHISEMVKDWKIVEEIDSSTTEVGDTKVEQEETDDEDKICSKVYLKSYMVSDNWWDIVRVSVSLSFYGGIIFTALLSLSIFWSSINLNPILFGLFASYLGQSSAFFFFDCDMCKKYGCEHSTGTDLAIASAVFWFISALGCVMMKFHMRWKRQQKIAERRERMEKIVSNQRSLVFKYFRSGNRRSDTDECSTVASSVEDDV